MSKHKGLPCQHTVNKGHNHATLFLLFFFAYAHAKRVRQVSCERVRTVPCACDHLIHCFPVEGHNCRFSTVNIMFHHDVFKKFIKFVFYTYHVSEKLFKLLL